MRLLPFVFASVGAALAQTSVPPLACIRDAIKDSERPRYKQLVSKLRAAALDPAELPDGLSFRIDERQMTLPEAAEWIALERKCCPFLSLRIGVTGAQPGFTLALTGPPGVKEFLAAEISFSGSPAKPETARPAPHPPNRK